MNDTVRSVIDAELAKITVRVQDPPTPPLGYGIDLSCVEDCDDAMSEVDPFSPVAVGQALIRRLITSRGSVLDDLDYGLDLRGYLNRGVTTSDLSSLATRIEGECLKDDRVLDVTATVTITALRSLRVALEVSLEAPSGKSFNLVFAVTDAQVLINTLTLVQ